MVRELKGQERRRRSEALDPFLSSKEPGSLGRDSFGRTVCVCAVS